jgi:hypothetical protein
MTPDRFRRRWGKFATIIPDATGSAKTAIIIVSSRSRTPARPLQTFLNYPDLLFVRLIPTTAKIIGSENLNG